MDINNTMMSKIVVLSVMGMIIIAIIILYAGMPKKKLAPKTSKRLSRVIHAMAHTKRKRNQCPCKTPLPKELKPPAAHKVW